VNVRVGQGFDVHAFSEGRALILGGVRIPYERGLLGHSDADVLTHALIDAILGALALGDIGTWFPDRDPAFKDADSLNLLLHVVRDPRVAPWKIANLDSTVIAQRPKLAPYIPDMRSRIAKTLGIDVGTVSVKATTTERLGFCGREEGIAALAVATLEMAEL
jgi:2-C-methyl-D-erythritol 2,4-cyclodiphosphate synthase